MIRIFTDTSANLTPEVIEKYGLTVLPFSYSVNGIDAVYLFGKGLFDGKQFYDAMRKGASVKTSLVNVGLFTQAFKPVLEAGDDIIYIGMSGGISGTANAARIAVMEAQEWFPERKITAIDTYAASLGEGIQVIKAAEMLNAGKSYEEIVDAVINEMRPTMCQYFTVDDLMYLKAGGRISAATAIIGNVLNIKPILTGDETGHIVQHAKVRGSKAAVKALADKYGALCADRADIVGIAHADNPQGAEKLADMLKDAGCTGEIYIVDYEPVTGAHVGPGTIALFFNGTEK